MREAEIKSERKVIMGSIAVSYGVKLSRAQVIAAYPITPQTKIVEKLSEFCATKELDAQFIKVESEHSAMACCIGASIAGARAFTATSSQGLALMHELLHWAAGGRNPVVMANVNRAMGPPWNIWADQTDSLSQRDTGWIQFYAESNQEVLDTIIQCFKISEKLMIPSMVNLDAFFLSHTSEPVEIPSQELVDSFLPPRQPSYCLDPGHPANIGGLARALPYNKLRRQLQEAMIQAETYIDEVGEEFGRIFGRHYTSVEQYRCEDAEVILVIAGTATSTARVVIDQLKEEGKPVGLVKIRTFRPFPVNQLRKALKNAKMVIVADRNYSYGCGGIFYKETQAALYNLHPKAPLIFSHAIGVGGVDITTDTIRRVIETTMEGRYSPDDVIWWEE